MGSPSFRVVHGFSPDPDHNELIADGPASDVPPLSKIWNDEFTIWTMWFGPTSMTVSGGIRLVDGIPSKFGCALSCAIGGAPGPSAVAEGSLRRGFIGAGFSSPIGTSILADLRSSIGRRPVSTFTATGWTVGRTKGP